MQTRTSSGFALSLALLLAACSPASSPPSGPSPDTAGKGGSSAGSGGSGGGGAGGQAGSSVDPTPTPTAGSGGSSSTPAVDAAAPADDTGSGSADDDAAPAADAAPVSGDAPPPPPGAAPGDPKTFSCNLIVGIAATGEWFNAGFEKMVDNSKWELSAVHSGFINDWADPNSKYWSMSQSSPCATNAKTPDRVIIVALYLHWMDATVEEWVTQLTAVVKNWKDKDPNLKRIELQTFVRAPGDKACPGSMPFKSWILPPQDEAYQKMATMFPDLVSVSPKFEVPSCSAFGGNPPHFSGGAASAAATQIAAYYNAELK